MYLKQNAVAGSQRLLCPGGRSTPWWGDPLTEPASPGLCTVRVPRLWSALTDSDLGHCDLIASVSGEDDLIRLWQLLLS